MKTKYDWYNVPKAVKWIATDADGWAWGWNDVVFPKGDDETWNSLSGRGVLVNYFYLKPEMNPFKGNWQDSLEERPNV